MRVLLVNDYPPGSPSGAEVHLSRLVNGLRDAGDDIELFAGEVRHSGFGRALDVWDPGARTKLRKLVDDFRPDVVHFHHVIRELSASVFGAPRRAARVLTVHDMRLLGVPDGSADRPRDRSPVRQLKMAKARFERTIARHKIDAVIAPSVPIANELKAAGFAGVHLVHHFADPGPEPGSPPSASDDVFYAGGLTREKGIVDLVEAFATISSDYPTARLLIAGGGPLRERLARSAEARVPGRVHLLGVLDESAVRQRMSVCRVVVAPSLAREAAGLTVIEAAFAGRPVIVSDDPALRELVDEASCGIVTPRGDVAALASALRELLVDPARSNRLGAAGRTVASATRSTAAGIAATHSVYEAARRLAVRPRA